MVISSINDLYSNVDKKEVGLQGLQFTSNSSQINHLSFIHPGTVIPFDFQYNRPEGKLVLIDRSN